MRNTSKMTAYQTLCYLASQERADEIAAFAKAEAEADERAGTTVLLAGLAIVMVGLAFVFFMAA